MDNTLPHASADAVAPAQASPSSISPSPPLDPLHGLPLWQRRYVLALAATGSATRAFAACHASHESIALAIATSPAFARAHDLAISGVAIAGISHAQATEDAWAPMLLASLGERALDEPDLRKAAQAVGVVLAGQRARAGAAGPSLSISGSQVVVQMQALSAEDRALLLEAHRQRRADLDRPLAPPQSPPS